MTESISRKPKLLRSLVLIVALIAIGAVLGAVLMILRREPPRQEIATLPPAVESVVVRAEDVVERFLGYGTAQPISTANLAAEVAGTVVERANDIRAGSFAAGGQILIRLDDRQYRRALERTSALTEAEQAALDELAVEERNLAAIIKTAEQELRVASDEKARVAGLFERDLAAKKEYDFANLAYQRARRVLQGYEREAAKILPRRARLEASKRGYEAETALARLNVERCEIKAPWPGQIQALHVDVGDRVGPGSPVLTLIDASRVEIPVQLPASVYDRVRVGAACGIRSESMVGGQNNGWAGEVARISPVADERTRTFAVYVVVDSAKQVRPLVPGTFIQSEVHGPAYFDALLVPRRACRNGQVFVVENNVARVRSVTAERFIEDQAMVTGGLHNADRVILSHLDQLTDGSPVRVRPAPSTASRVTEPGHQTSPDSSP